MEIGFNWNVLAELSTHPRTKKIDMGKNLSLTNYTFHHKEFTNYIIPTNRSA